MNSRERLKRCFYHLELDRPAVYTRTNYPKDDPSYDKVKAYFERFSDLRRDFDGRNIQKGYPTEQKSELYADNIEKFSSTLKTPKGNLYSSTIYLHEKQATYQESYYIKDRGDAEKFLSLPMPELESNVSGFFNLDRELGDRGIAVTYLGTVPGGRIAELCGSETLATMSVDDRGILHEICLREMNIMTNNIRYLLDHGVGPFFAMQGEEYIVPPLHGPDDFRDFIVRYDKPIIDLIHNAGGKVHIHCHGSIGKLLKDFTEMGVDVLHPVEAPPMGDVTAAEAKKAFRDRVCIEGNIQISHMYEHTPEQIREETTRLIFDTFDDRKGLIVSSTASPYILGEGEKCFEQYKAMIDTVINWK